MWDQICKPFIPGKSDKLWTNNNCESMNNILKLCANWAPQKMSQFVDKICDEIRLHLKDLKKSLYCNDGNYVLAWYYVEACLVQKKYN